MASIIKTEIKPPHATSATHASSADIGAFLDKHVIAPLEGIGKGLIHTGTAVLQKGSAGVFDHVQRAFPPLALISHPDVAPQVQAPAPLRAVLNVLSAAAENNHASHRQARQFMQAPVATMQALEKQVGDALWRNPMETREDVVNFFETLTPFTLMFPLRAMPAVPAVATGSVIRVSNTGAALPSASARAVLPAAEASSHAGKGDVIALKAGERQVLSVERAPQGSPPTAALPGAGFHLPSFSSLNWPVEGPAVLPDNVISLPSAEGHRPLAPVSLVMRNGHPVLRFNGPSYLGRGASDFAGMPGLPRSFIDAVKAPPPETLPTFDGLMNGPISDEISNKPAWHHFEGFSQAPTGVTALGNRIPQWNKLNVSGAGHPTYKPLPVRANYFPDAVAADFDSRWFSMRLKGKELTLKALGNNTFHLDRHGVLRYYAGGSTANQAGLYKVVAGLINHLGAKGQVPSVVAVQTYSSLEGGSMPAVNFLQTLEQKSARWKGFTAQDLRPAREQLLNNLDRPLLTPSVHVSVQDKQNLLFEAAQESSSKMPFADWGFDVPLPAEVAKLGDQDALVITYGRKGISNGWNIPSVHDASGRYKYFAEGATHRATPETLQALDRYVRIPMQLPAETEFLPHAFKSNLEPQGVVSQYSSSAGSIRAVSKDGHLEYDARLPDDPMGWNSEPERRDALRENMIHSLLTHLDDQGLGRRSWTVTLRPGDPDFQVYADHLKTRHTNHEPYPFTALSDAMERKKIYTNRVLEHEINGEPAMTIHFSSGGTPFRSYGDGRR